MENLSMINSNNPSESHQNWLRCLPNDIGNCFEQFDNNTGTPKRVTAVIYQLSIDFLEAIKGLTKFNETTCLSLVMAIDSKTDLISPYFEFKSPVHEVPIRLFEYNNLTTTVYSPTKGSALAHRGVSVNYRNELCLNWGALPYSKMGDAFHAPVQYGDLNIKGRETYLYLDGPQRVKRFVIPGTDLEALHQVVKENTITYFVVHFGFNNLGNGQLGVPFNPVIEAVATEVQFKSSAQGDCLDDYKRIVEDEESTVVGLDFVGACPPWCPDGPG